MINSINYQNLEWCFNQTSEDVCLFSPIFNRKSGKTTNLLKLVEKYNGIYIGANAEVCKIAKKIAPDIQGFSPLQALNRNGDFDENTVFIIDEVSETPINYLKEAFPFVRMFGLVKWKESPNWMTLNFTETLLDDKESDFKIKNNGFFQEFFNREMALDRGLNIICGSY